MKDARRYHITQAVRLENRTGPAKGMRRVARQPLSRQRAAPISLRQNHVPTAFGACHAFNRRVRTATRCLFTGAASIERP